MKLRFGGFQQLGRALMLPIAVLPIAGLLLRLGQPDLLGWAAMAAAGDAIFSNLGLLFAVGVGVGLARENHGAAGLAALVGFFVTTRAAETLAAAPPDSLTKLSIPVGLLSGIIAGVSYNRFSNITLPSYLSFFGGRRFVPIVSGLAGLALAVVVGYAWPFLERGMDVASHAILGAGSLGLFAYGAVEPHPDRHRTASYPQQFRLVHRRRLSRRHRRPESLLRRRSDRRCIHVRVLSRS